jgi:hypothetical protein
VLDAYEYSFKSHIAFKGSPLKALTVEQVNSPQRLRAHLQRIADKHGTSSANGASATRQAATPDGGLVTSVANGAGTSGRPMVQQCTGSR